MEVGPLNAAVRSSAASKGKSLPGMPGIAPSHPTRMAPVSAIAGKNPMATCPQSERTTPDCNVRREKKSPASKKDGRRTITADFVRLQMRARRKVITTIATVARNRTRISRTIGAANDQRYPFVISELTIQNRKSNVFATMVLTVRAHKVKKLPHSRTKAPSLRMLSRSDRAENKDVPITIKNPETE